MSEGPVILFYVLLLVLPIAALLARRIPITTVFKFGTIWIVIFGVGIVVLTVIRPTI